LTKKRLVKRRGSQPTTAQVLRLRKKSRHEQITPRQPAPASHYDQQQYQDPDRTIAWRSWQQLPEYEVRIRTGDRYLGGENWAHYLGFELAATSQKVIRVSLIHLEGETAADIELSPAVPDAIVKICESPNDSTEGGLGLDTPGRAFKHWPDAVGAAGTSGHAFHYASRAASKPYTFVPVGR
jgi:hypothetical protein